MSLNIANIRDSSDLQKLTNCREAVKIVTAEPCSDEGREKKGVADSVRQKLREGVME